MGEVAREEPFLSAYDFVLFAYKSYDSTTHTREQVAERLPSWKLVARETWITGSGASYDEDPIAMFQDRNTLDCALVFTGTNYLNEVWTSTRDLFPRLRPKLSKCHEVSCVGHSLGGSLCEIFAACANSGRTSDPDYVQQTWEKNTPEVMEEIARGSVFYTDG